MADSVLAKSSGYEVTVAAPDGFIDDLKQGPVTFSVTVDADRVGSADSVVLKNLRVVREEPTAPIRSDVPLARGDTSNDSTSRVTARADARARARSRA